MSLGPEQGALGPEQGANLDGECAEDQRPNSGLREGEISHAEVNDALRLASKTIIFGQQNRFCLLYTSPSPRDKRQYSMTSST